MQRVDLRLIFTKFLLICWAAACIYVFIKYFGQQKHSAGKFL